MITRSPCTACGTPLAFDQRYCVECGKRVSEKPVVLPWAPTTPAEAAAVPLKAGTASWLPIPIQTAGTFAALALGFGVVVGTAISPNLGQTLAGPLVVQEAPPPAEAPVDDGGGGGGGAAAAPAPAPASPGTVFTDTGGAPVADPGTSPKSKEPKEKPVYASGTVVHQNPVASSYTLAQGGALAPIHTTKALPAVGTNVKVPVTELANRTSAEDGKRQTKGQSATAQLSGIVTWADDETDPGLRDAYAVSNRASSIIVNSGSPNGAVKPPPVGAFVRVDVEIRDRVAETAQNPPPQLPPPADPVRANCPVPATPFPAPPVQVPKALYESAPATIEAPPKDIDSAEMATVVQSVCEGQLLGSADDIRESGMDLIRFPDANTAQWLIPNPGVALEGFRPGQAVMLNVGVVDDSDGDPETRVLGQITGIRDDTGVEGADSDGGAQGDLK